MQLLRDNLTKWTADEDEIKEEREEEECDGVVAIETKVVQPQRRYSK